MIAPRSADAADLDLSSRYCPWFAPAKVNLFLRSGKRPDGFHEIATPCWRSIRDDPPSARMNSADVALTCDDPALTVGPTTWC